MIKNKNFIDRLNYIKKVEKYQNVELAELLDVNKSTISFYLNGRSFPSEDKFNKLVEVLSVSYDWLMGYSNDGIYVTKEIDKTTLSLSIEQMGFIKDNIKIVDHKIYLTGNNIEEKLYSKQFNTIPEFFTIDGVYKDNSDDLMMISTVEMITILKSLKPDQYQKVLGDCKDYIKDNSKAFLKGKKD